MGNNNKQFNSARKEKRDEFYTQLSDIANELFHYKDHFRDKVVYCNCDDPSKSNFVTYFMLNFKQLRLKKLIATHYEPATFLTNARVYKLEYTGNDNMPDSIFFYQDSTKR